MSHAATALREKADPRSRSARRVRRHPGLLRGILMAGGALVLIVGGLLYWLNTGGTISTDDAYVEADSLMLSTDVSGIVATIPVHEGEHVKKGQVLFTLQPEKFQIALNDAKANLAMTRLNLEAMQANYQAALRDTAAKQQQVNSDKSTYDRMAELVRTNAVTRQQYDDARFKLASDQQALAASVMQAKALLAKLGGDPSGPVTNNPAYKQAQAQVAEAERELNHATVRAPYDGIVTQVNKLQPGMYLSASTAAFALVSSDHVWVEAQPKETDLTWAKPGDHVSVTFDMYPGRHWDGVLQSIAPATDQQFSLLPAQNSSGNWVKVVQRVPVRIRVDRKPGDPPLVAGMSANVDIATGHERTLASLF